MTTEDRAELVEMLAATRALRLELERVREAQRPAAAPALEYQRVTAASGQFGRRIQ